jgi:hypothetical protein
MVFIQWHKNSTLRLFIVLVVSEHGPSLAAVQNTIVSIDPQKAFSQECVVRMLDQKSVYIARVTDLTSSVKCPSDASSTSIPYFRNNTLGLFLQTTCIHFPLFQIDNRSDTVIEAASGKNNEL